MDGSYLDLMSQEREKLSSSLAWEQMQEPAHKQYHWHILDSLTEGNKSYRDVELCIDLVVGS